MTDNRTINYIYSRKEVITYSRDELFGIIKEKRMKKINDFLEQLKEGKTFSFLIPDKEKMHSIPSSCYFEQHLNDEVYCGEIEYLIHPEVFTDELPENEDIREMVIANAIMIYQLLYYCDNKWINDFCLGISNNLKEDIKNQLYKNIFDDDSEQLIYFENDGLISLAIINQAHFGKFIVPKELPDVRYPLFTLKSYTDGIPDLQDTVDMQAL